ncbi:MAG TPA: MarR family transcriptional regulator [Clostridia bacterium]
MENLLVFRLGESIRLLAKKIGILEKSEFSCCGTTFSQYNAILEIGKAGEITLIDLAELLGLDNSTLSKTVNSLVNNDWVTREIDSKDRRYVTIKLTEKGRKIFEKVIATLEAYFKNIYESLPADKREQVVESVELLLEAVNKNKCC